MISMMKIASGEDAWRYFMSTVADDSAARGAAVDYYLGEGTPPGLWFGQGAAGLGLQAGGTVTAQQLSRLLGHGEHPLTGTQLASKYRIEPSLEERVNEAVAALPDTMNEVLREEAIDKIIAAEAAKKQRGSVAGFELVFNPPKSVSAWWALADTAVKEQILNAHHDAVQATIERLERDAARTRVGHDGVAQVEVQGVVAAGFDHWDTRDGDPQLHTHLLVANRVQGLDGKWRTLDSLHGLSPQVVTLSESYTATLMDRLTMTLGVEWVEQSVLRRPRAYAAWRKENGHPDSQQTRGLYANTVTSPKNQKWEIRGVPLTLLDEFSTRSTEIRKAKDELISEYELAYGKTPSRLTIWRLRSTATRSTRKAKHQHSLDELSADWERRARTHIGDPRRFADRLTAKAHTHLNTINTRSIRADDLTAADVDDIALAALAQLAEEKATWSRANANAAIERVIKSHTFRSPADREAVEARTLERVIAQAVPITPQNVLHAPRDFTTSDGASAFAPLSRELFTTAALLEAERRLLAAATSTTAPRLELAEAASTTLQNDQRDALIKVTTSGRDVDVLVGPAGAGKTTTLREVKRHWIERYGAGSVIGLAPSAAAAAVLADSLEITTDNTAMWLFQSETLGSEKFTMKEGQLVIVDEASLAGTLALDKLRAQAELAGAKLLLVGDYAQLGAVDAGGAFGLLADTIDKPAELTSVHRFKEEWEKEASKEVRLGHVSVIDAYESHGRIQFGDAPDMLADALNAWKADTAEGLNSLLIAADNSTVTELNERAQLWRQDLGELGTGNVGIAGGQRAYVGDRIVTRQNDRQIKTTDGQWVRNGSEWTIDHVHRDGSVRASRDGASVRLSGRYLHDHVQLAYATTAHRSQGRTVDTTHSLVNSATSREVFYVALTRGAQSNKIYVTADEQADGKDWHDTSNYRQVLEAVISNRGSDLAASQAFEVELERTTSIKQLAAEYETIASLAVKSRHEQLVRALPDDAGSRIIESGGWEALSALMRRVEANGGPLEAALPELWVQRSTTDSDDAAAVLHSRISAWSAMNGHDRGRLLIGLVTPATVDDIDLQQGLDEREAALQTRADLVLDRDIARKAEWTQILPEEQAGTEHLWRRHAVTIAAYRDRYGVDGASPLGPSDSASRQRRTDYERAREALQQLTGAPAVAVEAAPLPSTPLEAAGPAEGQTRGPRL